MTTGLLLEKILKELKNINEQLKKMNKNKDKNAN